MPDHGQTKRNLARKLMAGLVPALALALALAFILTAHAGQGDTPGASGKAAADGRNLVINIADITDQASFYTAEADGTKLEVIVVRAPDGTIRTAFNTCQVCYDSGRGYYVQSGKVLVCQNCGNRFEMSRVEVEAGGCNPWPIFAGNKTVTDETITISYDFLKKSKDIFADWRPDHSDQ